MGEVLEVERDSRTGSRTAKAYAAGVHGSDSGVEDQAAGSNLVFTGYARSQDLIVSAEIISGGEVVYRSDCRAPEVTISWQGSLPDSQSYYYMRVTTATGDLAWSSPVFVKPE